VTNQTTTPNEGRAVVEDGTASPTPQPSRYTSSLSNFASTLGRYSGVYVWLALIAIFAIWVPETFLTQTTLKSILNDQAITAILALGVLFAFAAGQFDLSSSQNLGLSAVVGGSLIVNQGVSWPVAVLITLAVGVIIGAVNGGLVLLGVDSFIVTLGMSSVLLAFTERIGGGAFIGPLPDSFRSVANNSVFGVPVLALYALIVGVLVWYVLEHHPIGRLTYATGANPDAARLAGVRTKRYVFGSLALAGLVSSLAGVLVAAKIGTVSPTVGPPYLLPSFAACLLGTTQIKVGRFNVWGTLLALLLLATGVKGVQLVGGQLWLTDLFNGVALVGAVTVAVLARKRKAARIKADQAARGPKDSQPQAAA